jgi:hypothetical protein
MAGGRTRWPRIMALHIFAHLCNLPAGGFSAHYTAGMMRGRIDAGLARGRGRQADGVAAVREELGQRWAAKPCSNT